MSRLSGQAAIVTGGAQGIGGATSRRLAEEGAAVLVADVDMDTANATAAAIADLGGQAVPMLADVSRSEDIEAMVARAVDEFGRLDILVNNAVSADLWGGNSPITDISEANFDAGMGILVKAHFLAAKQAVPHMEATGRGSIVNISSVHGMLAAPGALIYETGKHAVIGITRQMATELGTAKGITGKRHLPGAHRNRARPTRLEGQSRRPGILRGPVSSGQNRQAGGHSQCHRVPVFGRGQLHYGARAGR